jgi:signal transduction histidine kinase
MAVWSTSVAFFLGAGDVSTRLAAATVFYIVAAIFPPSFFVFSLLFPRVSKVPIGAFATASFLVTIASLVWIFWPGHSIILDAWQRDDHVFVVIDQARYLTFAAGFILFFALGVLVATIKSVSYPGRERLQGLTYVLAVVLMSLPGFYANLWLPYWGEYTYIWIGPFAIVIFLALMTYNIIRHGVFDVRATIMRATAYAMSITVMATIYFTLAYIASTTLFHGVATSGVSASPINIGLALVLALMFQPIRQFFDVLTNKIFYRSSYDTDEFITRLGEVLTSSVDLRQVLTEALNELTHTLKASGGLFIVYRDHHDDILVGSRQYDDFKKDEYELLRHLVELNGSKLLIVHKQPHQQDAELARLHHILSRRHVAVVLPLVSVHETVGYLLLGERLVSGYSKRDTRVLQTIAKELVIAIMNARSVQAVRELNAHLEDRVERATRKLRKSNEQLLEMDATKDEFVSMASHQLRTPLTSVKGYISMVLDGDVGDITHQQRQLLEEAFTSSERMVHLIGDFLNVSRLQTGKFMIDPHACDLAKVTEQEVESMQQIAATHGMKIVLRRPKRFPLLYIDEGKIRQVIMNFIDNAIYYSPDTAVITVSITVEDGDAVLRVIDKGMGVPKEVQKKLFGKFFRAENARTQRPDGTGIGLYLAKKVIDGHSGKLVFESSLGKGSTFGFRLPVKQLSEPPKAEPEVIPPQ